MTSRQHTKDLSKGSTIDMSSLDVDHPTAIASSEFKLGAAVKPSVNRTRTFTPNAAKNIV